MLKGFEFHGVEFSGEVGNQAVGRCPQCGKENKFYVNVENLLWDCKVCGVQGNFQFFLEWRYRQYRNRITNKLISALAKDRSLPESAFKGVGLGWDGKRYIFPVYNQNLKMADLRHYILGRRIMSTPRVKVGMFRYPQLLKSGKEKVYLCEGEWDTIALRWLLERTGKKGVVVGVPGAAVFKDEWKGAFRGRDVILCYDHDQAGLDGQERALEGLVGMAQSVKSVDWLESLPEGYDLRDLISDIAVKQGRPKKCYKMIHEMLTTPENSKESSESKPLQLDPISRKELEEIYGKWLHLSNLDCLKIMYGAIIANKIEGGDPLWLFLVAPPGGSKSELLMSLSGSESVHALTSITPHTLISGASHKNGGDPSLLPRLDRKILVIKDFTSILTMHYSVRDEIFGVLRDIYDGSSEKVFGNGITRRYEIKFGVLAGVTPIIENFNVMHASLGERFLKFRITGNWDEASEDAKIRKALGNISVENEMRKELKGAGSRYIQNVIIPSKLPQISEKRMDRIVGLAKFAARLRGVVDRDKYDKTVNFKPSSEVGTRIAKQLTKLGTGIAIYLEKKEIDKEVYAMMIRCALDTVPDRTEDIVRSLYKLGEGWWPTIAIINSTRLPQSTVHRLLQDLDLLKIVDKQVVEGGGKSMWRLTDYIRGLILQGRVFG